MERCSYTGPDSKKNSKKKRRLDDQNKRLMLLRGPVANLSPGAELLEYECELLESHKQILEELRQLGRISIASTALRTLKIDSKKCHVEKAGQEMVLCDGCLGGCPEKLTREQLNLLTDNFSEKNFLDFTQFGKVYRGKTPQGIEVSVKIWTADNSVYNTCIVEGARRQKQELLFLKQPEIRNQPHLVKSIGYCHDWLIGYRRDGDMVAVVYDLKPLDTLHNCIKRDTFTWHQRMNVALKFASLLEFLHSHKPPYLVRNIDAAHIMLDQDSNPVLFDFGMLHGGTLPDKLSATHGYTEKCLLGCHGYIDSLCARDWTEKADVFGFGVILLMLISKRVCDREDVLNCRLHDIPMPLVYNWARAEYKKLKSHRVGCMLVDESLKGDPSFCARDGKKVTKLAMRCVDCSNLEKRPTMAEVVVSLQSLQLLI
ncbi:probable serine/threonine-protein kinase PBL21 [Tripterygium wilfordii]|uniref:probable serine/threonine-protein kinase PBL21 n=1 Tax=Tripterygium wilfordii TaxID=458696 RepID=UPI0018F853D6|nr:probable serine/threonine-protein kinase PBL21 [Tripterygium wilfordii]